MEAMFKPEYADSLKNFVVFLAILAVVSTVLTILFILLLNFFFVSIFESKPIDISKILILSFMIALMVMVFLWQNR